MIQRNITIIIIDSEYRKLGQLTNILQISRWAFMVQCKNMQSKWFSSRRRLYIILKLTFFSFLDAGMNLLPFVSKINLQSCGTEFLQGLIFQITFERIFHYEIFDSKYVDSKTHRYRMPLQIMMYCFSV